MDDPRTCPYYLLTRAGLTMTALLKRQLAAAGVAEVRPSYLGALMCLWREDAQQSAALGRCAGLEPSTMTGLVDRMERGGLVKRRPDPEDRRAQRIHLTAHGRQIKKKVDRVVTGTLDEAMGGLKRSELHELSSILRKLLDSANKMSS